MIDTGDVNDDELEGVLIFRRPFVERSDRLSQRRSAHGSSNDYQSFSIFKQLDEII